MLESYNIKLKRTIIKILLWSEGKDMPPKTAIQYEKLEKILAEHYALEKIVSLRDIVDRITRISKVHVRVCSEIDYDEISLTEMNEDDIVKVIDVPNKKPVNTSALESQRLHYGDLVFTYRGKIGKVGRVDHEHHRPLIGNHGMMKITFKEENKDDLSKYVQAYLQTNLIKSFLATVMENKQITPELIGSLPIPYFESREGMSPFTTIYTKRRKARNILEKALELIKNREEESLLMINKPLQELSVINAEDNAILESAESFLQKLTVSRLKEKNIFLMTFEEA